MLKEERHRRILHLLRTDGEILAGNVVRALGVSEDTIRRDLQELDLKGDLQRVHGGAVSRLPNSPPYSERIAQRTESKTAIGSLAATLIRPGQTVFMDGGTTTLHVARALRPDLNVTVVTNSPPLAVELAGHQAVKVILIGGTLQKESLVVTGAEAALQVSQFRADLFFLGTCALHRKQGITVPSLEEAQVKRAMLQYATATVGVATADKLNTVAAHVVGPVEKLRYLIVEGKADPDLLRKYRKLGIEVLTA
jgi:DeoR/GlpR family transcriptional regulator of sugar metabolism